MLKKNNSCFFITTHSSVVIDLFSSNKNAQIVHIENSDKGPTCKALNSHLDNRNVLTDLDFKPSDVLLSNGVIWVEGPSDAVYLELLLDLYKEEIGNLSSLNYCIQSLSTALWKYAGFADFDWNKFDTLENQVISLAKINHNHLIVIDKDDNYENKKPSEWNDFTSGTGKNKARLIHESLLFSNNNEQLLDSNFGDAKDNSLFFWINDGTFETYLEFFIKDKGIGFAKYFADATNSTHFEKKRNGDNSSKSKVELAAEIAQFVLKSKFTIFDLAPEGSSLLNKIKRLIKTVEKWN